MFPNNLQQWCEEAGSQYALSYYIATCTGTSYSLKLAVSNAPDCVATACRADDTKALLKEHATARVTARLEGGGNFNCTLSHFRNRSPTALFAEQIVIQTNPPTPPQTPPPTLTPPRTPEPEPVQSKTPSTLVPYIPPSTNAPKRGGPTVNVEFSGGISPYKLNMLLAAVVTAFFFLS